MEKFFPKNSQHTFIIKVLVILPTSLSMFQFPINFSKYNPGKV